MNILQEILVPQESVNDEYLTVVGLNFANGAAVKKNDIVIELETSKAIATVEAGADGFITYNCVEGDEVEVNSLIAQVWDEQPKILASDISKETKNNNEKKGPGDTNKIYNPEFSIKALQLIEQNNLSKELFSKFDFVNEKVVLNYLNPTKYTTASESLKAKKGSINRLPDNVTVSKLSANKKREIEYLSSVQSGGLVSTIYIDINTGGVLAAVSEQLTYFKDSLLPLVVYECSRLLLKYPALNSFYSEQSIATYNDVQIGVAIDIDDGLKVVKLPGASKLRIREIENSIFELSNKYLDKKLTTADLTDITFTITDLSADAFMFMPLINKANSAILGISKIDTILNRTILSLSFDHRVTEGKTAGNFLSELKTRLESYSLSKKTTPQNYTCYKCLKNISEDMNDVGFIKVVTQRGEEKLICDMCLFNF